MCTALTLAYIVAVSSSWQLVLATVAILPICAVASRRQHGMGATSQKRAQALIAEASTVAGDAGTDIGTVAVFGMQGQVQRLYLGCETHGGPRLLII